MSESYIFNRWYGYLGGGIAALVLVIAIRKIFFKPKRIHASGHKSAPRMPATMAPASAPAAAAATPKPTSAAPGAHPDDLDAVEFSAAVGGSGTRVVALIVYPIKGCAGISMSKSTVNKYGLRFDREWMIVDGETGDFVTQRQCSNICLILVSLNSESTELTLTFRPDGEGGDSVVVPIVALKDRAKTVSSGARPLRKVRVWDFEGEAEDEGDAVAEWLAKKTNRPGVRLVRKTENHARKVEIPVSQAPNLVGFADAFPFLVVSEASVADLSQRVGFKLSVLRFRPNIIVATSGEDSAPYAEDAWKEIAIGKNNFPLVGVKSCSRCKVPTTNQLTGEVDAAVVTAKLREYRAGPDNAVFFGQNFLNKNERGVLNVGDAITIVSKHDSFPVPASK